MLGAAGACISGSGTSRGCKALLDPSNGSSGLGLVVPDHLRVIFGFGGSTMVMASLLPAYEFVSSPGASEMDTTFMCFVCKLSTTAILKGRYFVSY